MTTIRVFWKKPTERQNIIYRMAASIHKEECDQKPGPEYPSWTHLADWAKWDYIKRATKALNTITRKYQLKQRG